MENANVQKEIHDPKDKKEHKREVSARGRANDRQSGSGKAPGAKKGGKGSHNWGDDLDNVDEIIDQVHEEMGQEKET